MKEKFRVIAKKVENAPELLWGGKRIVFVEEGEENGFQKIKFFIKEIDGKGHTVTKRRLYFFGRRRNDIIEFSPNLPF